MLLKRFSSLILIFSSFCLAQEKIPQNFIILIGDGMGVPAVSASILSGNNPFTSFSSVGLSVTTALDNLITDSAAGATAIATGKKTHNGYISQTPDGEKLKTVFELAEEKGLSTGIVVTSSVTHATPAAFYSHTNNRSNEPEIARQLLETETDVVIGSGQKFFFNANWKSAADELTSSGYSVFTDAGQLLQYSGSNKIFAVINEESIAPAAKRTFKLSELVGKALNVLAQDKDGFVLMVEGSQIDWAAHENDPLYFMSELRDFTEAADTALYFAALNKNTLVLITADHETGGVSITGGEPDGRKLEINFSTFYHTAGVVPVFAKGPGEELFRGTYQNNEIGIKLFSLLNGRNESDFHNSD